MDRSKATSWFIYVLAGLGWKSCHPTSATGPSHMPGRTHPASRYGGLVDIGQVFLLSDAVCDGEEMREYVSVGWRSHHARLGLIRLDLVVCLAARECSLLFKSYYATTSIPPRIEFGS